MTTALEATPTFAKAMALKAWLGTAARAYGNNITEQMRADSLGLSMAALELNSSDAEVSAYAGYTVGFCGGGVQQGLKHVEYATGRCPSFAGAWASSGLLSIYAGNPKQAIKRAETALRLSPRDPSAFRAYAARCLSAIMQGDMEMLLECAGKGSDINPRAMVFLHHKAVALTELGRPDEAARERQRHMDARPGFNIRGYIQALSTDIPVVEALWQPMQDYLRKAGFPE